MPDMAQPSQSGYLTLADTRWLRIKRFRYAGFSWVISIGRHDGRRLNISWHRKPRPAEDGGQ